MKSGFRAILRGMEGSMKLCVTSDGNLFEGVGYTNFINKVRFESTCLYVKATPNTS
jgi:hypothetical protein